jgi:hypothetical protein
MYSPFQKEEVHRPETGGSLKVAEAVAELNPCDDLWEAVLAVEFAPFLLPDITSLKAMAWPVLRLRQPLVRLARCRTLAP